MSTSAAVTRLTEERVAAWRVMQEVLSAADAEGRAMSAEEQEKFTRAEGDVNRLGIELDARKRAAQIDAALAAPAPTPGVPSGDPLSHRDGVPADRETRDREYAEAFWQYARRGARSPMLVEQRDMGEASGAAGGYLVPPGFLAKITEVQKWYGGMREVANVIETATGQSLVWPVNDDTGNPATIIGENTQVSEKDMAFTQKTLGAFMWNTGAVRIGRALMQDSAFDLESVLADRFGKRFGRGENTSFTLGTGITGGVTSSTSGFTGDGVNDPLVGPSAAVVVKNLLTVLHSVDVAYRRSGRACWMLNDNSILKLQSIVDGNGRPIWIPAGSFGSLATGASTVNGQVVAGGVDTLLGYPIVVNNDLVSSAATGGGVPGLFGDFRQGYIIRDVVGSLATLRLDERYADFGEVGFIGYKRSDGNTDDPNAVRVLTNHV